MKESGMYYGTFNEIIFSAVVICFSEVQPLMILYMIDKLTDMLIDMCFILKRITLRRNGDVQVGAVLILMVILLEKAMWLQVFLFRRAVFGFPSLEVMLLLYVVFAGNLILKTLEWLG